MLRATALLCLAILMQASPASAQSGGVIAGDKEWLQPADFVDLSWNEIALICPPPEGICDGDLNSTTVTGYRWAGIDAINTLFNTYLGPGDTPLGPGPDQTTCDPGTCGTRILNDFNPTYSDSSYRDVNGWSVERYDEPRGALTPYMSEETGNDYADTQSHTGPGISVDYIGAWFYRDAPSAPPPPATQAVPTLGVYSLIFLIIGILVLGIRRLK